MENFNYIVSNTTNYPCYIEIKYNEVSNISTIDTTKFITIPEMASHNHIVTSPGVNITLDTSFFDFKMPGFIVDIGEDEDEVHYTHEEVNEALKEHHIEKELRAEHEILEKAYKEYKMLARLLQIEEDVDEK